MQSLLKKKNWADVAMERDNYFVPEPGSVSRSQPAVAPQMVDYAIC